MRKRNKKDLLRPWQRRLRRYFLVAFVFLFILFGIGFTIIFYLYPSEKLGTLISERLTDSMKRPVHVKEVSINPFGKIDIQDINIGFPENETMKEKLFFQMDRMVIHFKLLPLLRRRLDITHVSLDKPKLALVSSVPFEHMTEKTESYSRTEGEKELEEKVSLPISIGLFHLVLNDFHFDVAMVDSSGEKELTISGIHLDISDLYFPRHFFEEFKGARGKFRLFTEEGRVVLRNKKDLFNVAANLDVLAGVYPGDQWDLRGNIGFQTSASDDRSAVNLNVDLKGIGYGENIQVNRFDLYADQQKLLHVEGSANHVGAETQLEFSFQSDPIDLREIEQTFGRHLLSARSTLLEDVDISGYLHLKNGELRGDLENMHFLCQLSLETGNMQSQVNYLDVSNGNAHIQAEGIWTPNGLKDGTISGNIQIDRLDYMLNDTVTISTKGISLDCSSQLDSAFIPANGFARGHVDEMLDGSLDLKLDWASEESIMTKVKEMVLKGQIRADSLQLASLPNPSGFSLNGLIGMVADVNIHGLEDIRINLVGQSPGIDYNIDKEINRTPPLQMNVLMIWNTDSSMVLWKLDSATVQLNELFSGYIVGEWNGLEQVYDFSLMKGVLYNESVWEFLPERLKDQLKGIALGGREEAIIHVTGNEMDDSMVVAIEGKVNLADVQVDYPLQFVKVNDIQGTFSFAGSPEKMDGKGELYLGNIFNEKIWSEPLRGSRIHFDWGMIAEDSLWIDRGEIDIEPMAIRGDFFFGMGQLTLSRNIDTEAEFIFSSDDSMKILNGTWLQGGLSCRLRGKTINSSEQWISLSGELIADSLNVKKDHVINLEQIQGIIPFQFDVDLDQQVLLPDLNFRPLTWVEYESQRMVYQTLSSGVGNLHVRQIDIAGYSLNNLEMDFDIGRGYIQIPWFGMELLDGNVGGSVAMNLGNGSKENISYEIHANASQINSAALMEIKRFDKEETELNASMAFAGKGIDFEEGIDPNGFFYITKIESDFASTLLKAMDPQEADRSIRLTRRLLNMGWKPKLFSFELRHGYVYPSLSLTQPWYSPIRIPENLEYGRLPLAFFLNTKSKVE